MKINVAIVDGDSKYLNRLTFILLEKYKNNLSVFLYTDIEQLILELDKNKINVILVNEKYDIESIKQSKKYVIAYLSDNSGISTIKDLKVICKYQNVEDIYKNILTMYSEICNDNVKLKYNNETNSKVISVVSSNGGSGSSTVAVAFSRYLVNKKLKVLYLNLENFSDLNMYFHQEKSMSLSDVIYSLKLKKGNLQLKLESSVKRDDSGVYYFDSPQNAIDLVELTESEIEKLISETQKMNIYDYIVIDSDLFLSKKNIKPLFMSDKIIIVSDDTNVGKIKLNRVINTFEILDSQDNTTYLEKINIIHNKSNHINSNNFAFDDKYNKCIGKINFLHNTDDTQVVNIISKMNLFDKLL